MVMRPTSSCPTKGKMGRKDKTQKMLVGCPDVFAEILNVLVYDGERTKCLSCDQSGAELEQEAVERCQKYSGASGCSH